MLCCFQTVETEEDSEEVEDDSEKVEGYNDILVILVILHFVCEIQEELGGGEADWRGQRVGWGWWRVEVPPC